MKIKTEVEQEVEVKTLHVDAGVRYWEDAEINGIADTENGDNVPCKDGNSWKPIIDLETGQVLNWQQGKKARIHYKVCDSGSYYIKDAEDKAVLSIDEDYVPNILCPEGDGWGDYIIMNIDENGFISKWKVDLSDFREKKD